MAYLRACIGSTLICASATAFAQDPIALAQLVDPETPSTLPAFQEEQEATFKISSFEVEGPELIPRKQVMEILAAFQGRLITFSELRVATSSVEKLHAIAGYEVVRVIVPEQDLAPEQGLKLVIVDARLDVVQVTGNQFFSSEYIQSQLPVLKEGALINTQEMDKDLRLINENPALSVRVSLQPSDKPLLVDANVTASDFDPKTVFLTLDNTGTDATGKYRLGLVAQHNNVFGKGHMLSAQAVTSPGRWSDVKVFGLGYKVPFANLNSMLEFNFSDSSVEVGSLRVGSSALNISGSGTAASIKWTHLLDRWEGMDQRVSASYEFKDFNSDVRLEGGNTSLVPDVGSRPVGLSYQLINKGEVAQGQASIGYYKNFETSGKNSQEVYRQVNPMAPVEFDLVKFNTSYSNQLGGGDWRYSFAFDGQMSGDSLISGEQFGAGGIYSVRGFEERVISADSGARLSLELMSGNRNAWVKDWLPRLNFVAFLEGARLGLNSPPPGVKDEPGISSVGGGIRFAFVPAHQFKLDVARVLSGIPTQPSGETMVHFSFVTSLQ